MDNKQHDNVWSCISYIGFWLCIALMVHSCCQMQVGLQSATSAVVKK